MIENPSHHKDFIYHIILGILNTFLNCIHAVTTYNYYIIQIYKVNFSYARFSFSE